MYGMATTALGVSSSRGGVEGVSGASSLYQYSGITIAAEGSNDQSLLNIPVWDTPTSIYLSRHALYLTITDEDPRLG